MFLRVNSIYFYFFRELNPIKSIENTNLEVSWLSVCVHKDIVKPKLRTNLISENFIWHGINLPRQNIILVGNVYR